jgi:hypothetical protein
MINRAVTIKWLIMAAVMLVFFSACKEESPTIFLIPAEVNSYLERFKQEAQSRNVELETDNLIVYLSDSAIINNGNYVCGLANGTLTGELQNVIRIDTQCLAWRHSPEAREILLFHEFAHVFLERLHTDATLPNGEWKSIMTSQTWLVTDFYVNDPIKREYYLDELFDEMTEVPEWGK